MRISDWSSDVCSSDLDARIEVDVRVEAALDEVVVLERDLLEFDRDFEQRIVDAEFAQYLMRRLMDDAGARIVVLIDAVAEAEQAERIVRILRLLHPIADILLVADLVEHLQHFLVELGRAHVCTQVPTATLV